VRDQDTTSLEISVDAALDRRWRSLAAVAAADDPEAREQQLEDFEDDGRTEDRVRHDYTGRYPLELLQNAHDAGAAVGENGAVWVVLTKTALIVANEGAPFNGKRIRSLVRSGFSEKLREREVRRTIGYKGVGFTAVFEISDTPQVISGDIAFGFDRELARRAVGQALGRLPDTVPARAFPFRLSEKDWLPDVGVVADLRRGGAVTVIRLPLRASQSLEEVNQHVRDSIPSQVLLFMPHVESISLQLHGPARVVQKRRGRRVGEGVLWHLDPTDGPSQAWLMVADDLPVPAGLISALDDPLWTNVSSVNVATALPWDRGVQGDAPPQNLHVYFPTEDSLGRSLLVHGDFYVDSSRRHIETLREGGDITRLIGRHAARVTARLAASLTDQAPSLFHALAPVAQPSGFGKELGTFLDEALAEARIVRPADGGQPRRPREVVRLGTGSRATDSAITRLLRTTRRILRPGDDAGSAEPLLAQLGSRGLSPSELAEKVDPSARALDYITSLRLLQTWLASLDDIDRTSAVAALRKRRVVQDISGRWRAPGEVEFRAANVPDLPRGLRRTEVAVPNDPRSRRAIAFLEIDVLSADLALDRLLSALSSGEFGRTSTECRDSHRFARKLWHGSGDVLVRAKNQLGVVPVPTRSVGGKQSEWREAQKVYFPQSWSRSNTAERLYGFLRQSEFLSVPRPTNAAKARQLERFYEMLGVAREPRVLSLSALDTQWSWWESQLERFAQWQRQPDVVEAATCPMGHPQTPRRIIVKALDRVDEVIGSKRQEVRVALLELLAGAPNPYGEDATIYCTSQAHTTRQRRHATGYQRWLLESEPWIPVRNDPSSLDFRSPPEAWYGVSARRQPWLMVPQGRVSPTAARALRLVSAERPGPLAVERLLAELHDAYLDLAEAPRDIVATAEWLLRALNRSVIRREHRTSPPPMPATRDGRTVWTQTAVIDDVVGAGALPELDLLPGGEWRGLRRAYGVSRASELVRYELSPGKRVRRRHFLDELKLAEVGALLAATETDNERVAVRLGRLRENPVTSLAVRYAVGGGAWTVWANRRHFLDLRRDRRNRVVGAQLFLTGFPDFESIVSLAHDIAAYVDLPDAAYRLALLLTNPEAVRVSEDIFAEDVSDARRRITAHRRRRRDQDDDGVDILDLDPLSGEFEPAAADEDELAAEPAPGDDERGSEGDPVEDASDSVAPPSAPLPAIDHDTVISTEVVNGIAVVLPTAHGTSGNRGQRSGGGTGGVDWARLERDRRLYGRRGEEVAFKNERARLKARRLDPDLVRWVARSDETSPFDIESRERDSGVRYIEVKATSANDPSEPFIISSAELRWAARHRGRYWIYRVTDITSSSPRVYRYFDPLGEIEAERGYLRVSRALMALPKAPRLP
jgi:hypothetical protein